MTYTIVQNDTAPSLVSTLADSGVPVDLTGVNDVRFHMEDAYERIVVDADLSGRVSLLDADTGKVEYVFSSGDTVDVGTYYAEWEVEYSSGNIETFPSRQKLEIEVVEEIA